MPGGGTRSEVVPDVAEFGEGDAGYFGFSFVLPTGFPADVTTWQLLTQWKNDNDGSPPLELDVNKGQLSLGGGYGHPAGSRLFAVPLAPVTFGQRTDMVFRIVFSRDPSKATVDVWINGAPVLSGYHPAGGTLYPTTATPNPTASQNSYWKMGIYRDKAITQQAQYTIESAKIGSTFASVAP